MACLVSLGASQYHRQLWVCRRTKAIFVSFNADLQLFTQSIITFQFTDGGSIMVRQPGGLSPLGITPAHNSCAHQHRPTGSSAAVLPARCTAAQLPPEHVLAVSKLSCLQDFPAQLCCYPKDDPLSCLHSGVARLPCR